jgi:hypothetical protein
VAYIGNNNSDISLARTRCCRSIDSIDDRTQHPSLTTDAPVIDNSTARLVVDRNIMSQQKKIVDAVLLLRDDRRVADVCQSSVETIAKLLDILTMALNKALGKILGWIHRIW